MINQKSSYVITISLQVSSEMDKGGEGSIFLLFITVIVSRGFQKYGISLSTSLTKNQNIINMVILYTRLVLAQL